MGEVKKRDDPNPEQSTSEIIAPKASDPRTQNRSERGGEGEVMGKDSRM